MSQRNAKRPKQPCPSVGCEANVRQVASHVSHVHVKALRRKIESLSESQVLGIEIALMPNTLSDDDTR